MTQHTDRLSDYVDVAERIIEFRAKYPDGSLRPANPDRPFWVEDVPGVGPRLVYVAAAYRSPEDPNPGIGCAWEPLPGRTPYTRDSELMVAETSAWGRAIVAVGAADTRRGIASREEIRNRSTATPQGDRRAASVPPTDVPSGSEIDLNTPEGIAELAAIAEGKVIGNYSVSDTGRVRKVSVKDTTAAPTEKQLGMLRRQLSQVGLGTQELATGYLSDLLGREITSASDLTRGECSTAIDALINDGKPKVERSTGGDETGWEVRP